MVNINLSKHPIECYFYLKDALLLQNFLNRNCFGISTKERVNIK